MPRRPRVAIGPSSFGAADRAPLDLLENAGIEIIPNPYGRRLTESEIRDQLIGADGLLAGLEPLNREVLASASELRALARVGIGMTNVDLDAARDLGISVSNTPEAPTEAVAELTLAALLSLARRIPEMSQALGEKAWKKEIGKGIRGSTALIIGLGRIGGRVAEILRWLGADVLAFDPFATIEAGTATPSDLDSGLQRADFILLHADGEDVIIGGRELSLVKPGAFLLNAGRGGLVDETALLSALDEGLLAGAWLDVFSEEPYAGPLAGHPRVILTPHAGTYTQQCRVGMESKAVENLVRDLDL